MSLPVESPAEINFNDFVLELELLDSFSVRAPLDLHLKPIIFLNLIGKESSTDCRTSTGQMELRQASFYFVPRKKRLN